MWFRWVSELCFSAMPAGGWMGGVAWLADLDRKRICAGATSAGSAPIGDLRALYRDGVLSHVNEEAVRRGGRVGMKLKDFIDSLMVACQQY